MTTSPRTGNPVYASPAVHVIYRKDREFILRRVLPDPSTYQAASGSSLGSRRPQPPSSTATWSNSSPLAP